VKTGLLFIFLSASIAHAQTNVIAAKSHASEVTNAPQEPDNFGLPYTDRRVIKSVEYLKDDCIIETYEVSRDRNRVIEDLGIEVDTFCDHPFLKAGRYDVARIKAMYRKGTEFIGFEQLDRAQKKKIRKMNRQKDSKNSHLVLFFTLGAGLFVLYLFTPKFALKPIKF
jgi:hypothetical protein